MSSSSLCKLIADNTLYTLLVEPYDLVDINEILITISCDDFKYEGLNILDITLKYMQYRKNLNNQIIYHMKDIKASNPPIGYNDFIDNNGKLVIHGAEGFSLEDLGDWVYFWLDGEGRPNLRVVCKEGDKTVWDSSIPDHTEYSEDDDYIDDTYPPTDDYDDDTSSTYYGDHSYEDETYEDAMKEWQENNPYESDPYTEPSTEAADEDNR